MSVITDRPPVSCIDPLNTDHTHRHARGGLINVIGRQITRLIRII